MGRLEGREHINAYRSFQLAKLKELEEMDQFKSCSTQSEQLLIGETRSTNQNRDMMSSDCTCDCKDETKTSV